MEKDVYSSKEEFMRSQFPEFYKDSPKISTYQKEEIIIHDDSSTTYKEEVFIHVEEKINCSNNCLHEHCVIKDRLSIGKGKLTLVYRCLDCGVYGDFIFMSENFGLLVIKRFQVHLFKKNNELI